MLSRTVKPTGVPREMSRDEISWQLWNDIPEEIFVAHVKEVVVISPYCCRIAPLASGVWTLSVFCEYARLKNWKS